MDDLYIMVLSEESFMGVDIHNTYDQVNKVSSVKPEQTMVDNHRNVSHLFFLRPVEDEQLATFEAQVQQPDDTPPMVSTSTCGAKQGEDIPQEGTLECGKTDSR
ncbi:hypothetical protein Tco_0343355 [Tanacetum coccineum]